MKAFSSATNLRGRWWKRQTICIFCFLTQRTHFSLASTRCIRQETSTRPCSRDRRSLETSLYVELFQDCRPRADSHSRSTVQHTTWQALLAIGVCQPIRYNVLLHNFNNTTNTLQLIFNAGTELHGATRPFLHNTNASSKEPAQP